MLTSQLIITQNYYTAVVSSGNIQMQLENNFSDWHDSLLDYFSLFGSCMSGAEHLWLGRGSQFPDQEQLRAALYRSHRAGDKHSNAEPVSCSILTGGHGEFKEKFS